MAGFDHGNFRLAQGQDHTGNPITPSYRNTQNVRSFLKTERGSHFKFDGSFMAWLKDGKPKTMGDAADEWLERERVS